MILNNPQQQCSTDNVKGSKHQAAATEGVCDGAAAGGIMVRECGSDSRGGVVEEELCRVFRVTMKES